VKAALFAGVAIYALAALWLAWSFAENGRYQVRAWGRSNFQVVDTRNGRVATYVFDGERRRFSVLHSDGRIERRPFAYPDADLTPETFLEHEASKPASEAEGFSRAELARLLNEIDAAAKRRK
jgi:hypothetical protein